MQASLAVVLAYKQTITLTIKQVWKDESSDLEKRRREEQWILRKLWTPKEGPRPRPSTPHFPSPVLSTWGAERSCRMGLGSQTKTNHYPPSLWSSRTRCFSHLLNTHRNSSRQVLPLIYRWEKWELKEIKTTPLPNLWYWFLITVSVIYQLLPIEQAQWYYFIYLTTQNLAAQKRKHVDSDAACSNWFCYSTAKYFISL